MTWFFRFNLMATGEEAEECDLMVVGTYHVFSIKDGAPKPLPPSPQMSLVSTAIEGRSD